MARKLTGARGKTVRAFDAYIDLMDAADWIRDEMSRQLDSWDLTIMQFRVLERIYRHGPQYQQAISHTFRCSKQNVRHVVKGLESSWCVRRVHSSLPPIRLRDPSVRARRVRRLGRKRTEQATRRGAEDRPGRMTSREAFVIARE